jgi:hypothetical protein
MAETTDMKQQFATLASGAQSGQLIIEDGVAERCAKRCDDYVTDLKALGNRADNLVNVGSFGDLQSAQSFAVKLQKLGSDTTAGSGSYVEATTKRIEVIQQMADMFRKAGQAFKDSDENTKAQIRQTMKSIDK